MSVECQIWITPEGKQCSRRNTVRHGLTGWAVIGELEGAEDYRVFEEAVTADYIYSGGAATSESILRALKLSIFVRPKQVTGFIIT